MARRFAALIGFVAVVALALTLLYRVYVHHSQAQPYVDEREGAIVRLDGRAGGCVKFARLNR
jgi:hypothetical protein